MKQFFAVALLDAPKTVLVLGQRYNAHGGFTALSHDWEGQMLEDPCRIMIVDGVIEFSVKIVWEHDKLPLGAGYREQIAAIEATL